MQTATFEPSATAVSLTNRTALYPANNETAPMGTDSASASVSYEEPTLSSSSTESASATPHDHYGQSGYKLRRRHRF